MAIAEPALDGRAERLRFATTAADHRFFGVFAVAATVVILIGFSSTYGPKLAGGVAVPAIVHLHALVFTAWLALFITQVTLAARGDLKLHRKLGTAGMVLALVMLALGAAAAIVVTRAGHRGIPGVEFPAPAGFLLLNFAALLAFSSLAGAAWIFRNDAQTHKRLMALSLAAGLLPPGIARLPLVSGHEPAIAGFALAFILAGPIYDLVTRRRVHPAYLWGLLAVIPTLPPVVRAVSASGAWLAIADHLL